MNPSKILTLTALAALSVAANAQISIWNNPDIIIPHSTMFKLGEPPKTVHTHYVIYSPKSRTGAGKLLGRPALGSGPSGGYTASEIRGAYSIPANMGQGVICIVDAYDNSSNLSNFNIYSQAMGLPSESSNDPTLSSNKHFQVVYEGGTQPLSDPGGWDTEAALDIEMAHAMAPNAKIVLVEAQSASLGHLLAANTIAAGIAGCRQVSNSWGSFDLGSDFSAADLTFKGFPGVTFFASSGDAGAIPSWPSTSPYVVGVGGTALYLNYKGGRAAEYAWLDEGGGNSSYAARPKFQDSVQFTTGPMRGAPDVAALADPTTGPAICDLEANPFNPWFVVGGTSVACPLTAGMVNAANPTTYNTTFLASLYADNGTTDFYDVVTDHSFYPGFLQLAHVGYDMCGGIGTPNGLGGLKGNHVLSVASLSNVVTNYGTFVGNDPGDAQSIDGKYLVGTSAQDNLRQLLSYDAVFTGLSTTKKVNTLSVTFTGLVSATPLSAQPLAYNVVTGNWDPLMPFHPGTSSGSFTMQFPNPASNYVSSTGTTKVRFMFQTTATLRGTSASSFTVSTDALVLNVDNGS